MQKKIVNFATDNIEFNHQQKSIMKKSFLIIPALALLASCGGNQNQTNGRATDTTVTTDTTNTAANTPTETASKPDHDDDKSVAMQVWDILLKSYDPFETLEGDEQPTPQMIAKNRKYIKEESPRLAVFDSDSETEGFAETVACYMHDDGYWIVLDYWTSTDSPDRNLTVYNYQDGKLTHIDDYFPADFLSNGKYIGTLNEDEIGVVRDTDEEEECFWYKWDGKRFVKQ